MHDVVNNLVAAFCVVLLVFLGFWFLISTYDLWRQGLQARLNRDNLLLRKEVLRIASLLLRSRPIISENDLYELVKEYLEQTDFPKLPHPYLEKLVVLSMQRRII